MLDRKQWGLKGWGSGDKGWGCIMLGVSRRGESCMLSMCVCLNESILAGRWCVIEFFGQVWKLKRVW